MDATPGEEVQITEQTNAVALSSLAKFEPAGKAALVTGANKGLGREIARRLASLEMVVFAGSRDEQRGRAATNDLRAEGLDVRYLHLDVTDHGSIEAAAAVIDKEFGHLDVLVNNAGISLDRQRPPSEITVDVLRHTYETNVFGAAAVTLAMLPLLRRSQSARIVNMSSTQGSLSLAANRDHPYGGGPNLLAYNSSKTRFRQRAALCGDQSQLGQPRLRGNRPQPSQRRHDGRAGGPGACVPRDARRRWSERSFHRREQPAWRAGVLVRIDFHSRVARWRSDVEGGGDGNG
jgi:hypothetical protein